jgi:hypothetical protein
MARRAGMIWRDALVVVVLVVAICALAAGRAAADGFGVTGAAPDGVTAAGSPYRYVALTPGAKPARTVVERLTVDGGEVDRWWHLAGAFFVPAVAYDRSGSGLSADGRTLVLAGMPRRYPPKTSEFAIVRTDLFLRHPRRPGQDRPEHAIRRIELPGMYSFDAISPDGSRIYLIHTFTRGNRILNHYEVRALDTASGRLQPDPIVDPEEPDEQMQGLPVSRAMSANGRWAYTLYAPMGKDGEPFVHALDTARGAAVCVDLPQLEGRRDQFMLRLRLQGDGDRLMVVGRREDGAGPIEAAGPRHPVLEIDTESFAVSRPEPIATASSGGVPWLPIGLGAAALAAVAIWRLARWQRAPRRPPLEQG